MDPDTVWNAIYGQESNSGQNNQTSVTGAVGPGQIQPGTWAQYAQPGENINNNADNVAVSKRIVNDYYNRYNGDPSRIATAYFSGPGNVAPADNSTPYVNDRADPTGKKTSSYVSDVSKRLASVPQQQVPDYLSGLASGASATATAPAVAASQDAVPDYLSKLGGASTSEPAVYRTPSGALHITIQKDNLPIPVPGTPEFAQQEQQGAPSPEPGILQRLREATDPVSIAKNLSSAVEQSSLEANSAAADLRQSGQADVHNSNYFPSFPSADPSTWTGGGLLKTAAGATGQFTAPLTGAVNALVAKPVTQATGSPDIGENAAFLASTLLPIPKGVSAVKNQLAPARAIDTIVKAIGPENVPALVNTLRGSSRLTPMDANGSLLQLGQGLISNPAFPSVQRPLMDMVNNRVASAPAAINSAYTKAMGAAPDVVKMVQGLKDKASEVGKQMIEPALENAKPIPVKSLTGPIDRAIGSPEAIAGKTPKIPLNDTQVRLLNLRRQITSGEMAPIGERAGLGVGPVNDALKTGGMSADRTADFTEARRLLNSARRGFTSEEDLTAGLKKLADKQKVVGPIDSALKMVQKGPTEYRGADFVHGVQSRLREEAENLSRSATGSDKNMGHDLFEARNKLVDKIDEASGGTYRPALSKYRDAKQIDDAWESGFDTLKNRSGTPGLEDRPEALREWLKTATPEQVVAKRLGTRADIDQKIRGVKNQSLAGTGITKIEYNQEKLKDLFGDKEGSRLIGAMEDARREAETNSKLVAGSKTAETLRGGEALKVREVGGKGDPLGYLKYMAPFAAEGLNFGLHTGITPGLAFGGATAATVAAKGLHLGAQKLGQMRDIAKNNAFARALSALGPEREQVINRLMSHPAVVRQLNKSSNALSVP